MNEWIIILTMSFCSILFASGGTDIPVIGGQKWLRRFGIPIFLSIIAVLSHVIWWKVSIMAILLIIGLSAGYGENSNYWKKLAVFCMYSVPFLIIGWSIWVVITPIICLLLFKLSNIEQTANDFKWKYVEFAFGYLISVTFISCLK
jgi:hypothetical protein